ncbi:MAG: nitrate reductase molybdenum cofactor assembly chaperone [Desulfuromonadales bacterium]|nr:nitrate reductase molybdenum cofactor assembly chaperone [Desulfuromonadales bacterium]
MCAATVHQTLCRHFADLLSYPDRDSRQVAAACSDLLRTNYPEAGGALLGFTNFLDAQEAARVEEIFTATFDLQPACHPYVGYQLCGESQQRTMFLIKLQQLYNQHGFMAGSELPDHLSTMLRFIGTVQDRNCREELVSDGLLPALEKLLQGLDDGEHPYVDLLKALRIFLVASVDNGARPFSVARSKECCP